MIEFFRSLFGLGNGSGATAKERLRLVLLSDHLSLAPELVESLKADLLAVISKYMEIDESNADVSFEQREREVAMLANVPVLRVRKDAEIEAARRPPDSLGEAAARNGEHLPFDESVAPGFASESDAQSAAESGAEEPSAGGGGAPQISAFEEAVAGVAEPLADVAGSTASPVEADAAQERLHGEEEREPAHSQKAATPRRRRRRNTASNGLAMPVERSVPEAGAQA